MSIEIISEQSIPKKPKRNRSRERYGKSERSYIKHDLIEKVAFGQVCKFRMVSPGSRFILIDGNAGDGEGVKIPQMHLWDKSLEVSNCTPDVVLKIAGKVGNADVVLCEKHKGKRDKLNVRYPFVKIVNNHSLAPFEIQPHHQYALWISDPNGPRDHGVGYMREVARKLPRSDFIIVFNVGACGRILGVKDLDGYEVTRRKYGVMMEPKWWIDLLGRKQISITSVLKPSSGFHFRLMVISNSLSDAAKRYPFEVAQ